MSESTVADARCSAITTNGQRCNDEARERGLCFYHLGPPDDGGGTPVDYQAYCINPECRRRMSTLRDRTKPRLYCSRKCAERAKYLRRLARATGGSVKWKDLSLEAQHIQKLKSSAISPLVASVRGYRSVSPSEDRKSPEYWLARKDLTDYGFEKRATPIPGLLIPIWDVSGRMRRYQYRPDNPVKQVKQLPSGHYVPRINRDSGEPKVLKYVNPTGLPLILDVHPMARQRILETKRPLEINVAEGILKADSLLSVGAPSIGILGVWGWMSNHEPLPDWEAIPLRGRLVSVFYDMDILPQAGKEDVRQAHERLIDFLESRGARVRYGIWDWRDGLGVDDLLHNVGQLPADIFKPRELVGVDLLDAWLSGCKGIKSDGVISEEAVYSMAEAIASVAKRQGKLDGRLIEQISMKRLGVIAKASARHVLRGLKALERADRLSRDHSGHNHARKEDSPVNLILKGPPFAAS